MGRLAHDTGSFSTTTMTGQMMTGSEREMISIKEAAALTGFSESTIRAWIKAKKLPSRQPGQRAEGPSRRGGARHVLYKADVLALAPPRRATPSSSALSTYEQPAEPAKDTP